MAKYRSKPIVIEAEQWSPFKTHPKVQQSPYSGEGYWSLIDAKGDVQHLKWNQGWIETLEGGHIVDSGDYIVKGSHNEYYAVKPSIFKYKYVKIKEE